MAYNLQPTQIPIISGQYKTKEVHTSRPVNVYPVVMDSGLESIFLQTAQGVKPLGNKPQFQINERGGHLWSDPLYGNVELQYRVIGNDLLRVEDSVGTVTKVASIPGEGLCGFSNSQKYLAIVANGEFYLYTNGELITVDKKPVDAGYLLPSVTFLQGYFVVCDKTAVFATDILDQSKFIIASYSAAELDSDDIVGVLSIRSNLYVAGTYSVQEYQLTPTSSQNPFPFDANPSIVNRGAINPHCFIVVDKQLIVTVGSGKNESIGIYITKSGETSKVSSRDEDDILRSADKQSIRLETVVLDDFIFIICHTDTVTMIFDLRGSELSKKSLWHYRCGNHRVDINEFSFYPVRSFLQTKDGIFVAHPITGQIGILTRDTNELWGNKVNFSFTSPYIYAFGNGFQVYQHELVIIDYDKSFDVIVERRVSEDGVTWGSPEKAIVGKKTVIIQPVYARNLVLFRWSGSSRMSISHSVAKMLPAKY